MAGEYDINLSNGSVLATLYPLETNGPDNRSTPRLVQRAKPEFAIIQIGAISPNAILQIDGDWVDWFPPGLALDIVGSSSNDGSYTVQSTAFIGGDTNITLTGSVPSAVADGNVVINVFALTGDLTYRFVPTFQFDVQNSGANDGTYVVDPFDSYVAGDFTIIPVVAPIPSSGLPFGEIQYTISDTNSSLKLPGKGTINYGEMLIENIVRMTEHFAADDAPELNTDIGSNPAGDPLTGQLWYKTLTGEEGFLFYDGSAWSNYWDFDNGALIFRDQEDSDKDIYLTASETNLPAPWAGGGNNQPGFVIWNQTDPANQEPIFRVLSSDGTEELRAEHDGRIEMNGAVYVKNLSAFGDDNIFDGNMAIGGGTFGGGTTERTLTVEGDGIAVNADTGNDAGVVLDSPAGQGSFVRLENNDTIYGILDLKSTLLAVDLQASNAPVATGNGIGINIESGDAGASAPSYGFGGRIKIEGGANSSAADYSVGGTVEIVGGAITGGSNYANFDTSGPTIPDNLSDYGDYVGGSVWVRGGELTNGGNDAYAGSVVIHGGTSQSDYGIGGNVLIGGGNQNGQYGQGGTVYIRAGSGEGTDAANGKVEILGGYGSSAEEGGEVSVRGGRAPTTGNQYGGRVSLTGGVVTGTNTGKPGDVDIRAGGNYSSAATGDGASVAIRASGGNANGDAGEINITVDNNDLGAGFGSGGNINIEAGAGSASGPNGVLTLRGGSGQTAAGVFDGGYARLYGGNGGGSQGAGGAVVVQGGDAIANEPTSAGGSVLINAGDVPLNADGTGGSVRLRASDGSSGGQITMYAGNANTNNGDAGVVRMFGGSTGGIDGARGNANPDSGRQITIKAGDHTGDFQGGSILIEAGEGGPTSSTTGSNDGGNVTIRAGDSGPDSTPGSSFAGEIYLELGNVDGGSTADLARCRIRNGHLEVQDGQFISQSQSDPYNNEGAPAFTFGSDQDTGLFAPNTNTIGLSVGGNEALRIQNDGTLTVGFRGAGLAGTPYEDLITDGDDIPNAQWVENEISAISWREPVWVQDDTAYANSAAFPTSGTIDGEAIFVGMRVLFSDTVLVSDRDIFTWDGGAWNKNTYNPQTVGDAVYIRYGTSAGKVLAFNEDDEWALISGTGNSTFFQIEKIVAGAAQTVFTLTNPYKLTTDGSRLLVFVDGVKQIYNVGYTETDATTVTMSPPAPFVGGEEVEFYVVAEATTDANIKYETQTGLTGTPVITFGALTYVLNTDSLLVYHNGQKMVKGSDYNETTTSSITWTGTPLVAGDVLEFYSAVPIVAGTKLQDVDDVSNATPQDGDTLVYNSTTLLWEPSSVADENGVNFDELTANGAGTQTIFNTVNVSTVAKTAAKAFQQVFVNGVLQKEGPTFAYQVTGPNQITFNAAVVANADVTVYQL